MLGIYHKPFKTLLWTALTFGRVTVIVQSELLDWKSLSPGYYCITITGLRHICGDRQIMVAMRRERSKEILKNRTHFSSSDIPNLIVHFRSPILHLHVRRGCFPEELWTDDIT